ncbi:MAG: DMT family transporter [Candidatus Thorarchaeota archaeon]|nr:DMT family transporter [Candidatus Thorarchaeota archaeon]
MQMGSTGYLIGVVAGIVAAFLFAITNIIYKKLDQRISVLEIIATRLWVSVPLAVILILPQFIQNGLELSSSSVFVLFISVLTGMVIGDGCYFLSQMTIGVSKAYPIAMSYPLLVYTLAAIFLEEAVIISRIFGAIMVVIGVGLVARREDAKEKSERIPKAPAFGLLLVLLTIIAWAVSDITLQVGLGDIDPLGANFVRIVVGSAILLPIGPYSMKRGSFLSDKKLLGIVIGTGLIGFTIPILLMTYSVDYIGATVTSIIMASSPLFGAPLSVMYLKERMTRSIGAGTLLIFIGVLLVVLAI